MEPYLVEVAVDVPALSLRTFTYRAPCETMLPVGSKVRVPLGNRLVDGFVLGSSIPVDGITIKDIIGYYDLRFLPPASIVNFARRVAEYYMVGPASVLSLVWPPTAPLKKGFSFAEVPEISQNTAVDIGVSGDVREFEHPLLVIGNREERWNFYLEEIRKALDESKEVLALAPEIRKAALVAEKLKAFSGDLCILHSELTGKIRREGYLELLEGRKRICLGTRSAVFAPLRNAGLIIVDEEESESYKGEDYPYLNARTVALLRARYFGSKLILGSATPSLESVRMAQEGVINVRGQMGAPGVQLEIVDMRRHGRRRALAPQAVSSLKRAFEMGERAVVFVQRRGASTAVTCQECGFSFTCPRCSVLLAYHSKEKRLVCHTCGHTQEAPSVCPVCRGVKLKTSGTGIEKVVDEVRSLFPEIPVFQLDSDVVKEVDAESVLRDFAACRPACLVATSLALSFPVVEGISLACVVSCDTVLNMPAYASAEKAFRFLRDVSYWLGESEASSKKLLVQTLNPKHRSITALDKPSEFYQEELSSREEFSYPPFGYVFVIEFAGKKEVDVKIQAEEAADFFDSLGEDMDVLGPAPSAKPKVRGEYRWHVALRGKDREVLRRAVAGMPQASGSRVRVSVDVDPIDIS